MLNFDKLIGFLTGTIGTAIVAFLVEQLKKYQEFQRDVKKKIFEKRIEKAERAVGYYYTFLYTITEIKKAYEVMGELIKEFDGETLEIKYFLEVIALNGKRYADLTTDKLIEINSVHLYVDLVDDKLFNEKHIAALLRAFGEIRAVDSEIEMYLGIYYQFNDYNNHEAAERTWQKIVELLPIYEQKLQVVIEELKEREVAIKHYISKIRQIASKP